MKTGRARAGTRRGFTLIELLVTIALLAILLTVAVPSFTAFQRNAELSSTINDFFQSMLTARAEAMKSGRSAFMQPLEGDDWTTGWLVYVDTNGNLTYDAGADTLVTRREQFAPASARITIPAGAAPEGFRDPAGDVYVMFNGAGFPRWRDGSFAFVSIDMTNGIETRRLVSSPAGRIRVCKPDPNNCIAGGM